MRARQLIPIELIPALSSNIYFNLWSACFYTTTRLVNSSLPSCESLEQQCAQASINITTAEPQPEGNYPGWAYTVLPSSNLTFDFSAAIEGPSFPYLKYLLAVDVDAQLLARHHINGLRFR